MPRPVLYVLAGVNGAGKSSIGGYLLARAGLAWYNPDDYAREVASFRGCTQAEANGIAWTEGMRRLDAAIASGQSFAFETTLGGKTVAGKIAAAAATHDVAIWYCGLASPELLATAQNYWLYTNRHLKLMRELQAQARALATELDRGAARG